MDGQEKHGHSKLKKHFIKIKIFNICWKEYIVSQITIKNKLHTRHFSKTFHINLHN